MALGHTRLSIIGLDNGDQPIANADGTVHIVVNGELIYIASFGDIDGTSHLNLTFGARYRF